MMYVWNNSWAKGVEFGMVLEWKMIGGWL